MNLARRLSACCCLTALACIASMFLPCACAQQSEADGKLLADIRAKAEKGEAVILLAMKAI